jgi:ABC-type uncharacterized transport system ATPase subunit
VQALNVILLTAHELSDLRALLKQSLINSAGRDLFVALYSSWCHSPMATVSLCLLAQVISQLKGSKLLGCTGCYRRFSAGFDVSAIFFSQALQFPQGL